MARKARPAADWFAVRKDTTKSTVTSEAVAESGKAPPAQALGRDYPGERVKTPAIDDTADNTEELKLPRKCGCVDVKKCSCQTAKDEPVRKPLPTPTDGQGEDEFISSCMSSLNSEYPDEKQRAAVCYSQWQGKQKAADIGEPAAEANPPDVPDADAPGMMLALWTPGDLAKKLAQPDGEHPDDMHVTLGYYGKVGKDLAPEQVASIEKCVAKAAQGYKPVQAFIGGVGRFNGTQTSDNKDVLIAHVDSPGLHDVRDDLLAQVQKCAGIAKAEGEAAAGPSPKRDHGYTPHITLAYIDPAGPMPVHKLARDEFTFTHLVMAVGKERKMYALGEIPVAKKNILCPIVKADNEERLVTGIVLIPETTDAQGDIYSSDVIKDAAHNFLALYNKKTQLGLQHEIFGTEGIELVESWIAPVDMTVNGRDIKAGTWMMTVRVKNDVVWNKIKAGLIRGFSIGGMAKVQRLAA